MPLSDVGVPSVTAPEPEVIFGDNVTVPFAGSMMVSGLRSHCAAGRFVVVPVMTSNVRVYGAKLRLVVHVSGGEATMLVGLACESVYVVTWLGVNPLNTNCVCAVFCGSLLERAASSSCRLRSPPRSC